MLQQKEFEFALLNYAKKNWQELEAEMVKRCGKIVNPTVFEINGLYGVMYALIVETM